MKRIITFSACFMAATSLLVSCKKSDDNKSSGGNSIVGAWELTSIMSDKTLIGLNGDTTHDYLAAEEINTPCRLDNLYKFVSDGTYTLDEGPSKCSPSDPQIAATGTWKLNGSTITLDGQNGAFNMPDAGHFTVTVPNMVLYYNNAGSPLDSVVYTGVYSFKKM